MKTCPTCRSEISNAEFDAMRRRLASLTSATAGEPKEQLAQWMIANSLATGHGDSFEQLLGELGRQVKESRAQAPAKPEEK